MKETEHMKILMISTDRNLFVTDSDVQKRIICQASLLKELHVVVFSRKAHRLSNQQIHDNVWLYPTNVYSRFFYTIVGIRIGKRILTERNFKEERDIITCQDPFEAGLVGRKLSRDLGLSLELQIHTDFLDSNFVRHSFLNRARIIIAGHTLPQANCVRVVSEKIRQSLKHYSLRTIPVVLPAYVDVARLQKVISADIQKPFPYTILMYSRLEKEKEISLAFNALARITKSNPEIGIIVVGDGSQKKSLEALAKKLHISNIVRFLGWQEDIRSYFSVSDVFLGTSRYEGYGMTFIESVLAGCPIISTRVGIIGDIVDEQTARICGVGDLDCIIKEIRFAVEHKDEMQTMAVTAKKMVLQKLHPSWDDYLHDLEQLWRQCLKNDTK